MKKLAKSKPFGTGAHRKLITDRAPFRAFRPGPALGRMRRHVGTRAARTHEGAIRSLLVFRLRATDTLDSRHRECILPRNNSILNLDLAPSHLIVVGGSYVGLEFARMFRRSGSQVTVIEMPPRRVSREDENGSPPFRRPATTAT